MAKLKNVNLYMNLLKRVLWLDLSKSSWKALIYLKLFKLRVFNRARRQKVSHLGVFQRYKNWGRSKNVERIRSKTKFELFNCARITKNIPACSAKHRKSVSSRIPEPTAQLEV